jgi:Escherichia/Staphylococcus phage prohead protease
MYRQVAVDLQVRSMSKRLLCGIVVPYGVDQHIDDMLTERFERGAFRHQYAAANRIELRHLHRTEPQSLLLGKCTVLRDDDAGLYGEFRVVAESAWGDHYLALVREGVLHQWSVGFSPERTRQDGRTVVYTRASLFETALVPEGAYGELASVGALRAHTSLPRLDDLYAQLPKSTLPA